MSASRSTDGAATVVSGGTAAGRLVAVKAAAATLAGATTIATIAAGRDVLRCLPGMGASPTKADAAVARIASPPDEQTLTRGNWPATSFSRKLHQARWLAPQRRVGELSQTVSWVNNSAEPQQLLRPRGTGAAVPDVAAAVLPGHHRRRLP